MGSSREERPIADTRTGPVANLGTRKSWPRETTLLRPEVIEPRVSDAGDMPPFASPKRPPLEGCGRGFRLGQ